MSGNFYKGTSTDQDARFGDKIKKLIMSKQWPELFSKQVDMSKIDLSVIKPWLEKKVVQYIGIDDEVVQRQIINYLEQQSRQYKGPDPKELTIQITGYFESNSLPFMTDLWTLLLDAQSQQNGIPNQFFNSKKEEYELKKQQLDKLRAKLKLLEAAIAHTSKKIKKEKIEKPDKVDKHKEKETDKG